MKTLSKLTKKLHSLKVFGSLESEISCIVYDSRKIVADCLFVAIKGDNFDGHSYIAKAIELGSIAIVCEVLPSNYADFTNVAFIQVEDSRLALGELANAFYDFPAEHLQVIGITGTNGKTTCTFLAKAIWDAAGKSIAIIGTTGIYIADRFIEATHTTPESLELFELLDEIRKSGIETVVMEVSSHSLVLKRVAAIKFAGAIFTNLSHDHLDFHKTMAEYAKAKKILFDMLQIGAIAVVNSDDSYAELMLNDTQAEKFSIGFSSIKGNIACRNILLSKESTSFSIEENGNIYNLSTKLIGRFNVENTALVAVLALKLGIEFSHIAQGLAQTIGAPGRMERYILSNKAVAVVDYAHTPDALEKALTTCKDLLDSEGKLFVVFGCGGDRDKSKRPEMARIATSLADFTIITSDNPRTEDPAQIIKDVEEGACNNNYSSKIDRKEAIEFAIAKTTIGDILLIAGKGHEDYQVIGTKKIHFSDSELVRKYI